MHRRALTLILAALVCALLPLAARADDSEIPTVTHYVLAYELFPQQGRLEAEAEVTVENRSEGPIEAVPFLLYRLLNVDRITRTDGTPLAFSSTITSGEDEPNLQVNLVEVVLNEVLDPGDSTRIRIDFAGSIHGYSEVWGYVRDTISEEYTLLRDDTFAYPFVSLLTRESRYADRRFTYDLEVTIPEGYVVASGGRATGTTTAEGRTTYSFVSKVPVWRLDVAAARFGVRQDDEGSLRVYVLPGHEEGADRVLQAMRDSVSLYTEMFGSAGDFLGYTAIEIPKGWGSQAADLYFLQTAAAFEDADRVGEVYHEVGHNWNARPRSDVQRCRYFDEAFASYFEALGKRAFEGEAAWLAEMEHSREIFRRWTERDPTYYETPIVGYGAQEIGHLSYSKGAWSLYVLHRLVGDEVFERFVRQLLAESAESPVGFDDLERVAESVAGRDLDRYFDDWFRGAESSRLLVDAVPIEEILARYP